MGSFTAGGEGAGNSQTFTIARNATFSTGTYENGKFKKGNRTVTDKNGHVTISTGQTLDLRHGHLEILRLINKADGKEGIEESDLKALAKKKKGTVTNVFEKGNGVYIVEYTVQGEGRADNRPKAYMQFDFETPEERKNYEKDKKLDFQA